MDPSEISWQILIDFFNEKIKLSPSEFNSDEFKYPEKVDFPALRKNRRDLRFHLLRHYVQTSFPHIDTSESDNKREIQRVSGYLKKFNFHRKINFKEKEEIFDGPSTPPRKRKRRYENDGEDYIDDEKYELKRQIERLEKRNKSLEEEVQKLRAQKAPTELQGYNKLWPRLCLKAQICGLSVRMLEKLFLFLKSKVAVLNSIVVPGHTFIHSQRYMIPSLIRQQKSDFVANAKILSIALDGTSYQLEKFMAVLLFDEKNNYIVYGLKHYYQSDNVSYTKCVEEILGDQKDLIYSKTFMIISDTESATKKCCQNMIENIMKTERIIDGSPFWAACFLHITGSSVGYGYDCLSECTQTVISNISKIMGPCGNKYSANNISQNLKLTCSNENRSEINIMAEKGSRYHYKTHNARVLVDEYEWFMSFFKKTLETDRHRNNNQLRDVFQLLSKNKTKILLESGLFGCFWVYFLRPLWSYFSKPVKAYEAQKVLQNVFAFVADSENIKEPIKHLTQADIIFTNISTYVKEPSDDNVVFSEKIIDFLNKRNIYGSKITNQQFTELENITRSFFANIQWKYKKEFKFFCDKKLDSSEKDRYVIFSNQATESVFGHLKNNVVSSKTSHAQLMHRTSLVFNDTLNWAFEQTNSDALFDKAYKSRKLNKSKDGNDAIEHDKDLFDYLNKNSRRAQK